MSEIRDAYGRTFKVLRVSLLNRCNLGCIYCTGNEDLAVHNKSSHHGFTKPMDLMQTIRQLHSLLDLQTIRLTGGEPLLYHGLPDIIRGIRDLGIEDIKLTTNGLLLDRQVKELKEAGLRSINISLDAINEDAFFLVNKRDGLQKVLKGIDAAIAEGLEVKLNAVILKGVNNEQVLPLLEYAFEKNIVLRFLEVMAMGHLHADPYKYFFGQEEILKLVKTKFEITRELRQASATSNYWITAEGKKFGVIANESAPFCHDCNRLRLDSDGKLYGCLSNNHGTHVIGLDDAGMREALIHALSQKQTLKFVGSSLSMIDIGG